MENKMVKESTFMLQILFIKVIGGMDISRVLDNWLFKINMDTQEIGEIIRNMEKELTFMLMDKNIRERGFETRKMEMESIGIKMVTYIQDPGKTTESMVSDRWDIVTDQFILVIGKRANNMGMENFNSWMGMYMMVCGSMEKWTVMEPIFQDKDKRELANG